jgi:hypothetical protein
MTAVKQNQWNLKMNYLVNSNFKKGKRPITYQTTRIYKHFELVNAYKIIRSELFYNYLFWLH